MIDAKERLLLVGDNPFHNISHLSQERARSRIEDPSNPKYAASLILTAIENGANGFTFSVSETTLAILKELNVHNAIGHLRLYPVVPYAFDYVRLTNQLGIPGLARKFGAELARSKNVKSLGLGLWSALTADLNSILKTYLSYEYSRVRSTGTAKTCLDSIILHQLVTDMILALDLDWIAKSYLDFCNRLNIAPGFNTGNFPFLVKRFNEWNIDLEKVLVAAPFNKVGFQMIPSGQECERALKQFTKPNLIAISVLAAGYINPKEAAEYIAHLPNIRGVVVGVSKMEHAQETFSLFKRIL